MNKYISLDKRSKKAQREYHAKQRRTWGEFNPVHFLLQKNTGNDERQIMTSREVASLALFSCLQPKAEDDDPEPTQRELRRRTPQLLRSPHLQRNLRLRKSLRNL